MQELGWLREWLERVRSEVDAGITRVDAVFQLLDRAGPNQEDGLVRTARPKRKKKYKKKKGLNLKGVAGSGSGPMVVKAILKPKSLLSAGSGSLAGSGKPKGPFESSVTREGLWRRRLGCWKFRAR